MQRVDLIWNLFLKTIYEKPENFNTSWIFDIMELLLIFYCA